MFRIIHSLLALSAVLLTGCDRHSVAPRAGDFGFSAPSAQTIAANRKFGNTLPDSAEADYDNARRGLIAAPEKLVVHAADGRVIWNMPDYGFLQGEAPASVNPSLWRQEQLNNIHGLFRVSERVYQLRGFDIANMTLIEGDSGWIIVDTLTSSESARAALDFARQHLGDKPVKAIVFTHSHIDHFGGALGIATAEQVRQQGIRVIAPAGFMQEATSENVIAGVAMARRSALMYGLNLPRSAHGQVGSGLGKAPALGTLGILEPTETVAVSGSRMTIDGVEFVFQMVSGAEAPAEFIFYLPQLKVAMGAELVSQTMHNLYSLRGASVRDAVQWSRYIEQAMALFADAEVLANGHHWPLWGEQNIRHFLAQQRDLYRFIHDQSVRLMNQGLNASEIAERIQLPPALAGEFFNRGYYGSLSHNSKAVYQQYLGWFDANPAHLNPLPPELAAQKYVDLAGGEAALLSKGQQAYATADYRWAAELLNHLVFANPDNDAAKQTLANTYDQLGYQAESGTWRNFYLGAAYELRFGAPEQGIDSAKLANILANTSMQQILTSLSVRLDGDRAANKQLTVKIRFPDIRECYLLEVKNSVLHYRPLDYRESTSQAADTTLNITRKLFNQFISGHAGLKDLLLSEELDVEGSRLKLITFFSLFEQPDGRFSLVTP